MAPKREEMSIIEGTLLGCALLLLKKMGYFWSNEGMLYTCRKKCTIWITMNTMFLFDEVY